MSAPKTWQWHDGGMQPVQTSEGHILLADSFRLEDGRVRGLSWHRRRFLSTAGALSPELATGAEQFWDAAIALLPDTGWWFPRIEYSLDDTGSCRALVRLRPCPTLGREVSLFLPDEADPRTTPRIKGPDLSLLAEWKKHATDHGFDEPVLLTATGEIIETATANLVWWDNDELILPATPAFSGVTLGLLTSEAERRSIPVQHQVAAPLDLAGKEVWILNALHGIRRVTAWSTGQPVAVENPDFQAWRGWWEELGTVAFFSHAR